MAAEINLDTAKRKVDLLTAIARSAMNTAKIELGAAQSGLERMRELENAKVIPQGMIAEAEVKVVAAQEKLELLNFILSAPQ